MASARKRYEAFPVALANLDLVRMEEVFRLGALRDGIQLVTTDIRFPIFGQVIPRIEIVLHGDAFAKKITVRINQESPFMFDGRHLRAWINGTLREVACEQFVDEGRAPTGMYNFGVMRENGIRSFVFDYHTYCAYSCDYCFKENEWEVLAVTGSGGEKYAQNFDLCLEYVHENAEKFRSAYDIVWLCTGSIKDEETELRRHTQLARTLREVGYERGIYVSQVIPPGIRRDRSRRRDYLHALHEAGITRFNSGVEIVNPEYRRKYIHGFKGEYRFEEYVEIFSDAIEVFGRGGAGSCLLAGIEPLEDTLHGLDTLAGLSVIPAPTVFTPFVLKQARIPFLCDLDGLIAAHTKFHGILERNGIEVFSGVFSLA